MVPSLKAGLGDCWATDIVLDDDMVFFQLQEGTNLWYVVSCLKSVPEYDRVCEGRHWGIKKKWVMFFSDLLPDLKPIIAQVKEEKSQL